MAEIEETFEIVLINPETNEPYDKDDPIVLSKEDYDFIANEAEKKGLTFEEEFLHLVREGLKTLTERDARDVT